MVRTADPLGTWRIDRDIVRVAKTDDRLLGPAIVGPGPIAEAILRRMRAICASGTRRARSRTTSTTPGMVQRRCCPQ